MKKILIAIITLCALSTMYVNAQSIEKKAEFEGGQVEITSAQKLFSDCKLRMSRYEKDGNVKYGLVLEMKDLASHVDKGSQFTITFKDGSTISLSNLRDSEATVKREASTKTVSDDVTVYRAWRGIGRARSVSVYHEEPVITTTTFIRTFYIVTPEQIEKISTNKIKNVSIVTDEETIQKKASSLSKIVATLFPLIK